MWYSLCVCVLVVCACVDWAAGCDSRVFLKAAQPWAPTCRLQTLKTSARFYFQMRAGPPPKRRGRKKINFASRPRLEANKARIELQDKLP